MQAAEPFGGWPHGIAYLSCEIKRDCRRAVERVCKALNVRQHKKVRLVFLPECAEAQRDMLGC